MLAQGERIRVASTTHNVINPARAAKTGINAKETTIVMTKMVNSNLDFLHTLPLCLYR